MGSQEMTRYGMKERDFEDLAGVLAEIIGEGADKPEGFWRDSIKAFRAKFVDMQYCF